MLKNFKIFFYILLNLVIINTCLAQGQDPQSILNKIDKIAKSANAIVGVTAIQIESNKRISYNSTKPCFMASTVKVPIAITLLNRVDNKQESLDRVLQLNAEDSVLGSGGLYISLDKSPTNVSIKRLLTLMLINSDNSATDAILKEINGPNTVQKRLDNLGLKNIRVDRTILQEMFAASGASLQYLSQPHSHKSLETLFDSVPVANKLRAWKVLETDLSDTTTSDDMALLLAKLYKQQLLSPESTKLLIHIMMQCRTGKSRIKSLLPPNTVVAHKTGTWSIDSSQRLLKNPESKNLFRFASDVGIIALPKNKGHLALAVYVKSKTVGPDRNRVIAEVSKILYDYFVKN